MVSRSIGSPTAVQVVHVLAEDGRRLVVRLLDHAPDLVVDLLRDLLRVIRLRAHLAAEERHVVVSTQHARAELLTHPEPHDHLLRRRRDPLDVVRSARGDLVEDELLGGAATERHRHLVHQRALGRQVASSAGSEIVPAGAWPRETIDLVFLVHPRGGSRRARGHLVVGGDLRSFSEEPRFFWAGDDPRWSLLEPSPIVFSPRRAASCQPR
jgi:hypothetical protein